MSTDTSFTFTDVDLVHRLLSNPFTPATTSEDINITNLPFAPFGHPELIKALYELKHSKAYRLLNELTDPLSPQEAAAACLCALLGSGRLLNAVLDHCPPIAQVQFEGIGLLSNIVSVAVRFDLSRKLAILIHRGADPNRYGDHQSPLEIAFMEENYSSLWELLKAPNLEIELTEPILEAWGTLNVSPDAEENEFFFRWCCQEICHKLSSEQTHFGIGLPSYIPHQLRPHHALAHGNLLLAAQICETNSLSAEDHDDILACFEDHFPLPLSKHCPFSNEREWTAYTTLLKSYIRLVPDCTENPILRRAIACAAAGNPTQDEELLNAVLRLPAGPVHLKAQDIFYLSSGTFWGYTHNLLERFASKWDELLGNWLPLALDLSELTHSILSFYTASVLFRHFIFTGSLNDDSWDELLNTILRQLICFEQDLDPFFQPGKILTHAPADKLLTFLPQLSFNQRASLLLHVNSNKNYDL